MPKKTQFLAIALALSASCAAADPGYYVVTPYDNEGIRTIDFRYWTVKPDGRGEVIWPEIGFGYGVNSRWTTELFMSYIGSSSMATRPSTLNWQNEVLLTQGELPFDIAMHVQLISNRIRTERRAIEFGPVLQTDVGRTQLTGNLFFERSFGDPTVQTTQMKYQWQIRHRWHRLLHVGAQGFGELGDWDDWLPNDRQSHRAGPAVFTTIRLGQREAVKLQAAYLRGRTYGRSGAMFTLRAHYEF